MGAMSFGRSETVFLTRKEKETLTTLMVFLMVFLFTQSDEKTFFTRILKLANVHVPLNTALEM